MMIVRRASYPYTWSGCNCGFATPFAWSNSTISPDIHCANCGGVIRSLGFTLSYTYQEQR